MAKSNASIAEAFRTTLDLFETGLALMRQNLRRAAPEATDEEINRRLRAWLHDRPGAEFGDCDGPVIDVTSRRP
jgi:Rv0078B-related antitoxin